MGAALGESANSVEPRPGDARHFAAFISYSHVDSNAAAKLQRRLERYRLPKAIAQTRAARSQDLGIIFRDREDLAAASNLSTAIRAAISRAEALVVICSPDAAASPWVAAEIELFRELHPDRPILAALISGEPSVSFPAALMAGGLEPLAADLRPEGDGEQLGFLKIVAGIAGVPLDALIQRDAQRRIRRVTAITAGALAAVLAMGIMTTLALQARNEAALQRAEAEGLVEYMMTDLRQNLEGVGSFKVMDAVNARAMEHYRRQGALAELPADSLERRARVLHAMGEDLEKRDELEWAQEKFREAHKATGALLSREPQNAKRIFAHGQSEYWVGRIAERTSNWRVATVHYNAYADAAKKLIAIDPQNIDYMMEMGWGHLNIGIVQLQSRQEPDFGEQSFVSSIEWMKKAATKRPEDSAITNEIGNAYAWLADSHYLRKDFARSLDARRRELVAKIKVAATDPSNNAAQFELAKARYAVAANLIKLNRNPEALPLLAAAQVQIWKLIKLEPRNREWQAVKSEIEKLKKVED